MGNQALLVLFVQEMNPHLVMLWPLGLFLAMGKRNSGIVVLVKNDGLAELLNSERTQE